jgi:PST family polysaccharide transporter
VLGSVLSPVWFFQGVEKMSYLAIINITIRTISTILIFIMIKSQSDYILFITINSSTFILIGLTGLFIAINKFKIQIKLQSREMIFKMIRDGWNIFLSSVWINLYTTSNTFILGLFTNNTIVGYFAAADKIRIAFQGLQSTVSQSVFPFVSKLAKESVNDFLKFNRKLFKFSGISGLVISLIILFFASEITNLILGKNFAYSADILRIISFLPFLISLSNVAGIQTMIPLGYDKSFNKIIAFAAFVHIALLLIFVPDYIAYGVAYTVLLTETIVTFLMLSFLRSKKINLFIK